MSTKRRKRGTARATLVFVVIVWFGLAASMVGILTHLSFKILGVRWYAGLSRDFVWMTPITDFAICLVPATVLFVLSRQFPKPDFLKAALFVGSLLFFAKCLILYGRLHPVAVVCLATGLAVQLGRHCTRYAIRWQRFLTLSATAMALVFVILAFGKLSNRALAEHRALAELPQAASGAPNVLFITLDTVAADHVSLYGYKHETTPNLKRWTKKGAWFKRALTTAPWTLPSHASMFTGRYPQELSTTWNTPLDDTYPTLAEVLRDHGYITAGFVANRYYAGHETGLGRGFVHYEDYNYSAGEFLQSSVLSKWFCNQMPVRHFFNSYDIYGRKNAAEVNSSFLGWLEGRGDRPFFAFLNYFDAHDPYVPPLPFDTKFGPPPTPHDRELFIQWWHLNHAKLPAELLETAERAYASCLAYLDDQLGRLLEELEQRKMLANTLIVITSDHGEHFGEHRLYLHGQSLYRDLIHVPLVLIQPGRVGTGVVVEDYVTQRDLAATVLDLAGVERHPIPGNSLARCWNKPQSASNVAAPSPLLQVAFPIPKGYACPDHGCSPVASGAIVSLFKDGKHYIRNMETGFEEIYDFDPDPDELNNLALLPQCQPLVHEFRDSVQELFVDYKSRWVDFP